MNTDRDGDTDDDGCEEIADEKNDSCVSCVNWLDEIKRVEENFSVKMNELEERHQQQLIDLRMSHNAELSALKRENAELTKEKEEKEKQVNEMKQQIRFLSGVLRESDKKEDSSVTNSRNLSDEQRGNLAVTMAITRIVGMKFSFEKIQIVFHSFILFYYD